MLSNGSEKKLASSQIPLRKSWGNRRRSEVAECGTRVEDHSRGDHQSSTSGKEARKIAAMKSLKLNKWSGTNEEDSWASEEHQCSGIPRRTACKGNCSTERRNEVDARSSKHTKHCQVGSSRPPGLRNSRSGCGNLATAGSTSVFGGEDSFPLILTDMTYW